MKDNSQIETARSLFKTSFLEYRIPFHSIPLESMQQEIRARARSSISFALQTAGKWEQAPDYDPSTTVAFHGTSESHFLELYLHEIHEELVRLCTEGKKVNPVAIMMTDPRFSEMIVKFKGLKVRGETVTEHELAHAFAAQEAGADSYVVVTPYVFDGMLRVKVFIVHPLTRRKDHAEVSIAPRLPTSEDMVPTREYMIQLVTEGKIIEAIALFSRLVEQAISGNTDKNEDQLLELFLKRYLEEYPLPNISIRNAEKKKKDRNST